MEKLIIVCCKFICQEEMLTIVLWDDPSDDDLTPYDMSEDVKMSKASQPRYLRDCLESMWPLL